MGVSTAAIPGALKSARESKGMGQKDLARIMYVSDKTVSAIETGRRHLPADVGPRVAQSLDDPELYCALQMAATGGVASPWLDGEKVDLHRSSIRDKAIEELSEVITALSEAKAMVNCRSAEDLNDEGRKQIMRVLHQAVEGQTALQVLIGKLCETYGFSMRELYMDHQRELKAKGYVKEVAH